MTFTEREQKLLEFAKFHHGTQKRKYTKEPYYVHLVAVATGVYHLGPVAVAIAICHDLIEDTSCSYKMLFSALVTFGYSPEETADIITGVRDLTDFYTKDLFPNLNRRKRKELEAVRLGTIGDVAKNVKYADIADNVPTIVEFDEEFRDVFIREKLTILEYMKGGSLMMRQVCEKAVNEGFTKIQSIVK
jgi:(p)ppGpp synthase/HD superfamily hydrolase